MSKGTSSYEIGEGDLTLVAPLGHPEGIGSFPSKNLTGDLNADDRKPTLSKIESKGLPVALGPPCSRDSGNGEGITATSMLPSKTAPGTVLLIERKR